MKSVTWNPTILEQRIGRAHRLGRQGVVHVINFVSEESIEQGMLDLLSFKKSLFAGVLDGGQEEVLLGGGRLKKFMESVEKVTDSIPQNNPDIIPTLSTAALPSPGFMETSSELPPPKNWEEILSLGLKFADKLGKHLFEEISSNAKPGESIKQILTLDQNEKKMHIQLPLPKPATLENITQAMHTFAKLMETWE